MHTQPLDVDARTGLIKQTAHTSQRSGTSASHDANNVEDQVDRPRGTYTSIAFVCITVSSSSPEWSANDSSAPASRNSSRETWSR